MNVREREACVGGVRNKRPAARLSAAPTRDDVVLDDARIATKFERRRLEGSGAAPRLLTADRGSSAGRATFRDAATRQSACRPRRLLTQRGRLARVSAASNTSRALQRSGTRAAQNKRARKEAALSLIVAIQPAAAPHVGRLSWAQISSLFFLPGKEELQGAEESGRSARAAVIHPASDSAPPPSPAGPEESLTNREAQSAPGRTRQREEESLVRAHRGRGLLPPPVE